MLKINFHQLRLAAAVTARTRRRRATLRIMVSSSAYYTHARTYILFYN